MAGSVSAASTSASAPASASPSQRRRSVATPSVRPISAAQLLFPADVTSRNTDAASPSPSAATAAAAALGEGGVENVAFDLGSSTALPQSLRDDNCNIEKNDNVGQQECQTATDNAAHGTNENENKIKENSRMLKQPIRDRQNSLQESSVRRRDDNDMWRRRKTDPPGDGKYSYHRDYQEALSSLLWQPYDCRGQTSAVGEDGNDSEWLNPPVIRRTKAGSEGRTFGCRSSGCQSSYSSTSSMSSSSSSAALGAIATTASNDDGACMWRNNTEISPSSLSGLIMSTSASIEEEIQWNSETHNNILNNNNNNNNSNNNNGDTSTTRGLPVDGRLLHGKIGNIVDDPNQHDEEVVSDLHIPWVGTSTTTTAAAATAAVVAAAAAARTTATTTTTTTTQVLPVGALPSRCAAGECELCLVPQCERFPGCVDEEDCCLCCERANMLLNVDMDTGGGGNSACVNSEQPLVSSTPTVGIVSAVTNNNPTFTSSSTNLGNSVSVVNCYRAMPVVVSAVPTIPCNSVCNVHIVQTTPVDSVVPASRPGRTFTSTEAQTDDIGVLETITCPPTFPTRGVITATTTTTTTTNNNSNCNSNNSSNNNREQRRRERRERRHQRRLNNHNNINGPPAHHHHHPHEPMWQTQVVETGRMPPPLGGERLPDILNSHLPPPYTTLPLGIHSPPAVPHPTVPVPVQPPVTMPVTAAVVPGSQPPPPPPPPPPPAAHHHPPGMRFPFQITPTGRRRTRGQHYTPEEEPKSCCGVVVTQTVSIRWFIVMIAFVGICCAVVGTVLGAMKASGREHLTVSLLMIGVGIVLITVSGVAWRLTAHDAPSCRMMFGLGGSEESGAEPNRRFVPRLPPSYGRPHHPYAAMMYPEFQYRPPPPSYQASMQEYRLRLLLLDRHPGAVAPNVGQAPGGHTVSPPPTYRSHTGSTLSRATLSLRHDQLQSDYSRPPSYRSRTSSTRPTLDPSGNSTAEHSRDPSLSLSESGGGSSVVNVISVTGNETENLDNIKLVPDQEVPLRMMLNSGNTVDGAKNGNLVTIVQTGNDSSPVIVTVSGSTMATTTMGSSTSGNGVDTEMELLAHL